MAELIFAIVGQWKKKCRKNILTTVLLLEKKIQRSVFKVINQKRCLKVTPGPCTEAHFLMRYLSSSENLLFFSFFLLDC